MTNSDGFIPEDQYKGQATNSDGFIPEGLYKAKKQVSPTQQIPGGGQGGSTQGLLPQLLAFLAPKVTGVVGAVGNEAGATGNYLKYKLSSDPKQKAQAASDYANNTRDLASFEKGFGFDNSKPQGQQFDPVQYLKGTGQTAAEGASYMTPLSAEGLAAKVGLNATSGTLSGLSQDNPTIPSVAASAGTSAILGPMAEKIPGLTKGVGKTIEDVGKSLPLRGLRISPSQATGFVKKTGQDIGDYLYQHGITGDFEKKAGDLVDSLTGTYNDMAANSGRTLNVEHLDTLFKPMIDDLKKKIDPAYTQTAENMAGYLEALKKKYTNGQIPVQELVNEKKDIQHLMSKSDFTTPQAQQDARTRQQNLLLDAIDHATAGYKSPEGLSLNEVGRELRNAMEFENVAKKQSGLGKGSGQMGLVPSIVANGGAMLGGLPGWLAGLLAGKLAVNPSVISGESKAFMKGGQMLQKASETQLPFGISDLLKKATRGGVNNGVNQIINP